MHRLLVVEDDPQTARLIDLGLHNQFLLTVANRGSDCMRLIQQQDFDAVILDLGLPDIPGRNVCHQIRSHSTVPIIILSGQDAATTKIELFSEGADDYLIKPFNIAELRARLQALLRRSQSEEPSLISLGTLVLDLKSGVLQGKHNAVSLSRKECDVLAFFMLRANIVLTKRALTHSIWSHKPITENALEAQVKNLRHKLSPFNEEVTITVHYGFGYKLSHVT